MRFSASSPKQTAIIFLVLASLLILVAGGATQHWLSTMMVAGQQDNLLGISKLKASQIGSFLAERHGDAEVFVARPAIWSVLSEPGNRAEVLRSIKAIDNTRQGYGYRRILLFNAHRKELLNPDSQPSSSELMRALAAVMKKRNGELVDFHLLPDGNIVFGLAHPVFANGDPNAAVIGAVYLECDVQQTLFPMLRQWVGDSKSGETMLARREGDTLLFLSKLRFLPDQPPLSLRIPLAQQQSLEVRALSGSSGLLTGTDYRGITAIGGSFPITGTPWIMITKQDRSEIEALARTTTLPIFSAVTLLLLLVTYATHLIWRLQHQSARLEAATAGERHLLALKTSIDGFFVMEADGRLLEHNAALLDMLGFAPHEVANINLRQIDDDASDGQTTAQVARRETAGAGRYTRRWRRKDGKFIDVEINASFSQGKVIGFAHDISIRRKTEQALQASEAALQMIIANSLDAVVRMDAAGFICGWSGQAEAVFGWQTEEVMGRLLADLLVPKRYRELHTHGLQRLLQSGHARLLDKRIDIEALHRDGHEFPVELTITQIERAGKPEFSAFLRDISDRRKRENEFSLAATVFATVDTGVMVTGPDNRIIAVNPGFSEITGYGEAEVIGHNPRLLSAGTHPPEFFRDMWKSISETGAWRGEIQNRRKDGSFYVEWLSIRQVKDPRGQVTHHVAAFTDISERKSEEARIRHLAHYDALTDLPNRTLFLDRLSQAVIAAQREQRRLALLFIDLDKFKPVNDQLGHHVGDLLLQQVARRLLESVRSSDTAARLGGDEFTILLPVITTSNDALAVAEKIQVALGRVFDFSGCRMSIGASIGIALYPEHGNDEETLLRNADAAMYCAKQQGSSAIVVFSSPMDGNYAASGSD